MKASRDARAETVQIPNVNITSPKFHASPFAHYALLRNTAPVHPVTLPDGRVFWMVTRHADVTALLQDRRFVKSLQHVPRATGEAPFKPQWMPGFAEPMRQNMLDLDGADHARLRALAHLAFTPRLVERLRVQAQQMTRDWIDAGLARGGMDIRQELALPLPATLIALMLGVPPQDQGKFHRWSNRMVNSTSNLDMLLTVPSLWQLVRYVRGLIALKRSQPADDLITAFVLAGENGVQFSDDEIVAMIVLLLIAGHETTVSLISSGVLALLQHPKQWELLCRNPELVKPAVEELLRYASPVAIATERYATEDVEIAGVTIPRGAIAAGALLSANHDERQFDRPGELDITRVSNKHVSFGHGVHYCLGAPLARLEAQIALGELAARAPKMRLAVPEERIAWRRSLFVRAPAKVPVKM